MFTKVKFVEVPDKVLPASPPDGLYGVVHYDGSPQMTRYGITVDRVFPWWISICKFEGGLYDEIASGSSAGDRLQSFEVDMLYLVEVPEYMRPELEQNLARHGFELEPAELTAA